jgi:hypothetical protein
MARSPTEQFEVERSRMLRKKRLSEELNTFYEQEKNLHENSPNFMPIAPRRGYYADNQTHRYSKGVVKCQCPMCRREKTNSKRSGVGKPRNYSISDQRKMDSMKDMEDFPF